MDTSYVAVGTAVSIDRPGVIESTHTRCQPKPDSIGIIASLWRRLWPFGATPEIPAPSLAIKIEMRNQGSQRDIAVGRNVSILAMSGRSEGR